MRLIGDFYTSEDNTLASMSVYLVRDFEATWENECQ